MVRPLTLLTLLLFASVVRTQEQHTPPTPQQPPSAQTLPAGRGRGGVPVQGAELDIPLVERFDKDGNKRLDYAERTAARAYLAAHPELRRTVRPPSLTLRGSPGRKLAPKDVQSFAATVSLYDAGAVRTIFLEFERDDWEQELAAFYHTDVEVPATVIVDGKTYRDVGISFRGNNSFTAVPEGLKRPLTLSFDAVRANQHLLGYRTLHLLNSNQDPTYLRSVLYLDVAREYIPVLKANFMRVVINGESWGVYPNQQAFNREFLRDAYKDTAGKQWKSPNNSVGGGLSYLGDDVALYRRWYEMKGKDDPAAWQALMRVTRILNETPVEQLEQALAPVMDVDGVLKFLALDVTLINGDGYWNDGSDFNLYFDAKGRLHLTPHDANEGFRGGGRGGPQLDPLTSMDDPNKALRHKLLAVPALRTRYLAYVGDIADKWLDWNRLGPVVERHQKLIATDVASDSRKLDTTEAFTTGVYGDGQTAPAATTIKGFADQRRAFLLAHPEVIKARAAAQAQTMPDAYQAVLKTLAKSGDFRDGVLKVNLPRADVAVTIAGRPAPTPFGFGGWVAFTKGDHDMDVMMGDLVLTEDEVNPVMSAILTNGLQVTALHNHFFWDQPRMFYMHVHGHGAAAAIANQLKAAVDVINGFAAKRPKAASPTAPAAPTPPLDAASLAKIIGTPGEQSGAVYKITIGRPDIEMREHGALINSRMGLNTWAAFTGSDADAMVAGDVAMLEHEVTPVLAALRANGLDIVAIHHHMTDTRPVVIFLHYFGTGPASQLAKGVRAALDLVGRTSGR
jgi:hypothetical protein